MTSNLYWIALFYIHTNLDTGLSLFLVVIALYFAIRQKNDAWFGVAAIFMILLGLTRSENVILAALVIILTVSTFDISHRKLLWTFLPYLIIQIVWNMAIIYINPIVFSKFDECISIASGNNSLDCVDRLLAHFGKNLV